MEPREILFEEIEKGNLKSCVILRDIFYKYMSPSEANSCADDILEDYNLDSFVR